MHGGGEPVPGRDAHALVGAGAPACSDGLAAGVAMKVSDWLLVGWLAPMTLVGCESAPPTSVASNLRVTVASTEDAMHVYPCANVGVVGATPFHVWKDPDSTQCTEFRLAGVQLLVGPTTRFDRAPYSPGQRVGLLVRQETSTNILFAPGYNPVHLGDGGFWAKYEGIRRVNPAMDGDYRAAVDAAQLFKYDEKGGLTIGLVPVSSGGSTGTVARSRVDHSMLVFLLELDDVWASLRTAHGDPKDKEAVILIGKTIDQMAKAHHEKWPDYKWDSKPQHVIDWCHSVAAE